MEDDIKNFSLRTWAQAHKSALAYNTAKEADELSTKLARYFNGFGDECAEALFLGLTSQHPTLQQRIVGFMWFFILHYAETKHYDARNEEFDPHFPCI